MKYAFLLTNRDGDCTSIEKNLENDASANQMAAKIVLGNKSIQDVTAYRLLGNDSCGPIQFIGTFILSGNQVINRSTHEAI